MKTIKYSILFIMSVLFSFGCEKAKNFEQEKTDFTDNTTRLGLYDGKNGLFTYSSQFHQVSLTGSADYSFRLSTDDMSKVLNIDLEGALPNDMSSEVDAEVYCRGMQNISENSSYTFVLTKIEGNKAWLWAKNSTFGVIVPIEAGNY